MIVVPGLTGVISALADAGVNWTNIANMAETDISGHRYKKWQDGNYWSNIALMADAGVNWTNISTMSITGINWEDIQFFQSGWWYLRTMSGWISGMILMRCQRLGELGGYRGFGGCRC